jgi:hypothetical protein
MIRNYSGRILDIDVPAARTWGRVQAKYQPRDEDVMIGATALLHGCVLVTRNVRHFVPMGIDVFNPYVEGSA